MVYAADFVTLLLKQRGDTYDWGAQASDTDPDPSVFDCSELVRWGCARLGVRPTMPDGTWTQYRHCHQYGTVTSATDAARTSGALLFRFSSDPLATTPQDRHVAVSLGNGSTIEAMGKAYGVGSWSVAGRTWTHWARVPGLVYSAPPKPPPAPGQVNTAPRWPGRLLMYPPATRGPDVIQWQHQMNARGVGLVVDGVYGPASRQACRNLQAENGLTVDGIVGGQTWQASWVAPMLAYPSFFG